MVVGVTAAELKQPLPIGGEGTGELDSPHRRPVPGVGKPGQRGRPFETGDYGLKIHTPTLRGPTQRPEAVPDVSHQ